MPNFRKSLAVAAGLLASLAVAVPSAGAQTNGGIPGGPFATAFRVQNLGTAAATCSYELYSDTGTRAFSQAIPGTIAAGESVQIFTPSLTGLAAGTYAGVVSCDQEVAAVVNFSSTDPARAGGQADSYVGSTNPASTVFVPSAYNNYFNYYSTFRIQNTTATAQNVTVDYFAPGAATAADSQTVQIPANGAATVGQAGRANLRANTSYSARVRSTTGGALAVTVSIYGGAGTNVSNQVYAFSAFAGGATTFYNPVIMRNYYGYNTATTIQNIGDQAAQVRLTYSNGEIRNNTIQPGSSWLVLDFNEATLQRNVLYSSRVESLNGEELIVTVNESTPGTNRASTYESQSTASRTQLAPITMKRYFGYNSSVTCQNVGTVATNVTIAYRGTAGSTPVNASGRGYTIQPGATQLFYQPTEANLPDNFIGSATLTSTAADIVCVVNQDKNEGAPATQALDFLSAYNAIRR